MSIDILDILETAPPFSSATTPAPTAKPRTATLQEIMGIPYMRTIPTRAPTPDLYQREKLVRAMREREDKELLFNLLVK